MKQKDANFQFDAVKYIIILNWGGGGRGVGGDKLLPLSYYVYCHGQGWMIKLKSRHCISNISLSNDYILVKLKVRIIGSREICSYGIVNDTLM